MTAADDRVLLPAQPSRTQRIRMRLLIAASAVSLVVAAIAGAGGVPIIAHPAGRAGLLPAPLVQRMLAAGLAGFELGHRENVEPALTTLRELVAREGLIVTGSSDYHGLGKPNLPGEHTTGDDMVARIIDRATGSAPVFP